MGQRGRGLGEWCWPLEDADSVVGGGLGGGGDRGAPVQPHTVGLVPGAHIA